MSKSYDISQFERRDLFNKAADFLQKEEWAQGHMQSYGDNGNMSYCLVGALRMVTHGSPYLPDPDGVDDSYFGEETLPNERYAGFPADDLLSWNDGVAKNVQDVVTRLREMAAGKHDDLEAWRQEIQAARS